MYIDKCDNRKTLCTHKFKRSVNRIFTIGNKHFHKLVVMMLTRTRDSEDIAESLLILLIGNHLQAPPIRHFEVFILYACVITKIYIIY